MPALPVFNHMGLVRRGDVETLAEDPGDNALLIQDGRVAEGQVTRRRRLLRGALIGDVRGVGRMGFARRVDLIEELEEPLPLETRKGLTDRPADPVVAGCSDGMLAWPGVDCSGWVACAN